MIERIAALAGREVSRETFGRLEKYVDVLLEANRTQNLIGPSTEAAIWERHIADGAQLLGLAPGTGSWCDVGSGGGLPGMVIAILGGAPMTLVEPRRLRADFLTSAVETLGLSEVSVSAAKVEKIAGRFDFVTARAVAPASELIAMTERVTHPGTIFILPKGKSAQSELEEVQRKWQGEFRLEPSRTSEDAAILIGNRVRGKGSA